MKFSADYLHEKGAWLTQLAPFAGQPVAALEIGSYEGRSSTFLMRRVLTHHRAVLVCVDPFELIQPRGIHRKNMVRARQRFLANTRRWRSSGQLALIHTTSRKFFAGSPRSTAWRFHTPPKYAVIYVDGNHAYREVLFDLRRAWLRLIPGGVMIVDDLIWDGGPTPELLHDVGRAWDTFTASLAPGTFTVLHRHIVGFIRKEKEP